LRYNFEKKPQKLDDFSLGKRLPAIAFRRID
jgi:hypothetical protein